MSYSTKIYLGICICLIVAILPFFTGCEEQQKGLDLYLDGIMLQELGENELAIEKLNAAVESNKRLYLAYSALGDIYLEKRITKKALLPMKRQPP